MFYIRTIQNGVTFNTYFEAMTKWTYVRPCLMHSTELLLQSSHLNKLTGLSTASEICSRSPYPEKDIISYLECLGPTPSLLVWGGVAQWQRNIWTPRGGMPPQQIFDMLWDSFWCDLRQIFCLQLYQKFWGISWIWMVFGAYCHWNSGTCARIKPSRNSQTDLKISSIEDTHSGRLCWTCFQKPSPPP